MTEKLKHLSAFLLDLFNRWFVSDSGVWQTLGICLIVVVAELMFPGLDPHAFLLMAVLTVYSAITQPALARAGRVSGDRQAQMLGHQQEVLSRLEALEASHSGIHEKLDEHGAQLQEIKQEEREERGQLDNIQKEC